MKTSHKPAAPKHADTGPLDWRILVGWLREDAVISADEAARTIARCASAHSKSSTGRAGASVRSRSPS